MQLSPNLTSIVYVCSYFMYLVTFVDNSPTNTKNKICDLGPACLHGKETPTFLPLRAIRLCPTTHNVQFKYETRINNPARYFPLKSRRHPIFLLSFTFFGPPVTLLIIVLPTVYRTRPEGPYQFRQISQNYPPFDWKCYFSWIKDRTIEFKTCPLSVFCLLVLLR